MKKITVLIIIFFSLISLNALSIRASTVIEGPSVIYKAKNTVLPISDILDFYHSDLGHVGVSLDNYTGLGNVIGDYSVELYVVDESIIISRTITIVVVQDLPSKVKAIGDNSIIYTNTSNQLTLRYDILPALESINALRVTNTTAAYVITDQYSSKFDEAGNYDYQFRLVDASGSDNTYQIKIIVKNSQALPEPDFIYTPPKSLFRRLLETLSSIVMWGVIALGLFFSFKFLLKAKKAVITK